MKFFEGMVFTNALSTCPICGPYRGMLQSGRYGTNSGLLINWVDPDKKLPQWYSYMKNHEVLSDLVTNYCS